MQADTRTPLLSYFNMKNEKISIKDPQQGCRLIDRKGYQRQSHGTYNISRVDNHWREIYTTDLFHTLVNAPTTRILLGIALFYSLIVLFFAICYRILIPTQCNTGITNMLQAWFFSLETIMTIGYGAPKDDVFYGNCSSMAVLLTMEAYCSIILDSICIGIFFTRFSRPQKRAGTIAFTTFAIIKRIRQHYYFCFRVCERRKHQLVEAHVRCYAVRNEYNKMGEVVGEPFRVRPMRLNQPDDDLGATLIMALPFEVIHRIDPWSPLYPLLEQLEKHEMDYEPSSYGFLYPDPPQRAIDAENGNRECVRPSPTRKPITAKDIDEHLRKAELEVLVILEGIDPPTSATIQARHSYTIQDLVYDCEFAPCVQRDRERGGAIINFDAFYQVLHQAEKTA